MGNRLILGLCMVFMISLSPVLAIPGQPHWFYGDVTINGEPAIDGITISVKVSGETVASTATSGGQYGYDPLFYVEDPYGDMVGKTLKFYLDGVYVADHTFENFGYTELDFSISTTCGDDVCEPGEDSSNCCTDCGCPAGYDCESNTCVEQIVDPYCGDGICNNGENCASCSADCGACPPSGGGGGTYVPPPSSSEPTCGDDSCNGDETCDTCAEDCGACPAECEDDSDCDDGDACTVDICAVSGDCEYGSITSCINGDGCCPTGCDISTDSDCSCVDECTVAKCEDGYIYDCLSDGYGCKKWQQTQLCTEGCCGAECCEGEVVALGGIGGLTGFAVFDGGFIPFLYIIIGLVIVGGILFYIFRIRK